jgi:hypothetical protein
MARKRQIRRRLRRLRSLTLTGLGYPHAPRGVFAFWLRYVGSPSRHLLPSLPISTPPLLPRHSIPSASLANPSEEAHPTGVGHPNPKQPRTHPSPKGGERTHPLRASKGANVPIRSEPQRGARTQPRVKRSATRGIRNPEDPSPKGAQLPPLGRPPSDDPPRTTLRGRPSAQPMEIDPPRSEPQRGARTQPRVKRSATRGIRNPDRPSPKGAQLPTHGRNPVQPADRPKGADDSPIPNPRAPTRVHPPPPTPKIPKTPQTPQKTTLPTTNSHPILLSRAPKNTPSRPSV